MGLAEPCRAAVYSRATPCGWPAAPWLAHACAQACAGPTWRACMADNFRLPDVWLHVRAFVRLLLPSGNGSCADGVPEAGGGEDGGQEDDLADDADPPPGSPAGAVADDDG